MSVGNLKTYGNKGNNIPYQLRSLQLLSAINDSINALPGVDYETRTTTYEATAGGTGYVLGNIIVRYDIIDVATSTVTATVWFNQTTQTTITPAPLAANLTPINAPIGATILNGGGADAVNIQDGGNSITVDGTVTANAGTGNFTVVQATASNLNTTIGNAGGGSAVNIQDGGNAITVDDGGVALAIYPFPATPVSGYEANLSNTTPATIITTPGGGQYIYLTQILVTNASSSVATVVSIQDSATGILYTGYAASAGGGFTVSFPTPLKCGTNNLEVVCGTTGSSIYVSVNGFVQ